MSRKGNILHQLSVMNPTPSQLKFLSFTKLTGSGLVEINPPSAVFSVKVLWIPSVPLMPDLPLTPLRFTPLLSPPAMFIVPRVRVLVVAVVHWHSTVFPVVQLVPVGLGGCVWSRFSRVHSEAAEPAFSSLQCKHKLSPEL